MIGSTHQSQNQDSSRPTSTPVGNSQDLYGNISSQSHGECRSVECSSYNVGHISHIPRTPPTPATYTIPGIINKSTGTEKIGDDMFGVIKLGDNDVCYTSGTIEWVGRKRNFPINSGFKIISQNNGQLSEPVNKKFRLNKTYTFGENKIKECDCADVLPTVNAIVDHLNALHEAVDLLDLRLNNLEDVSKQD